MVDRPEDFMQLGASLHAPGITQVSAANTDCPPVSPLKVDGISTLHELLVDYSFYTPALLHLTVPLQFDPFAMFCEEMNEEIQPYQLSFDIEVFSGLVHPSGDASWNHALFCLPKHQFEAYIKWIGCCAFNDSKKKILRRVRTQQVTVLDPLAKLNGKVPKPIPVTALVIETNIGSFYLKTDVVSWLPKAFFDNKMVYSDTKSFAEAINSGHNNPYDFVEQQNACEDIPPRNDGGGSTS